VHLIRIGEEDLVDKAGRDMLAVADGIIFGCQTHMGGPSWQFKRFSDPTMRVWRHIRWRDKLADGVTPAPPGSLATGRTPNTPYIGLTKS